MFKVGRGSSKEISLVQGEEQRLRFAGAAMKRYPVQGKRNPSKMVGVARGHQRADTLKPYSQKTSQVTRLEVAIVRSYQTHPHNIPLKITRLVRGSC